VPSVTFAIFHSSFSSRDRKQVETMATFNAAQSASIDLVERTSYISSAYIKEGYMDTKTPMNALEGGALRAGGAPNLWTREHFGLLAQYAGVGLIYGALPYTVSPFLQEYLNMENTQIASARVLLLMPWSFKVVYGIISDCIPIFGYRRRPYMVLGWFICALMLFIMSFLEIGKPFYTDRQLRNLPPSELVKGIEGINWNSGEMGGKFIVFMMLAAVGYVMADVAADAVVVELAQREPIEVRGTTQTTIYFVRSCLQVAAMVLTGFGLNSIDYGGDFDTGLSFNHVCLILAIATVPVIPVSWLFISEEKMEAAKFSEYIGGLWKLIQNRAVYQVIAFRFFSTVFENMSYTPISYIGYKWAHVTPLNENIVSIIGQILFCVVLWTMKSKGLNWDWRLLLLVTEICVIIIDSIPSFLTVWDVVRNQWFYLGLPLLDNLPGAIHFIVGTYVVVELADVGNEGAVYGLITTVSNLASPFSTAMYKNIDREFDVTNNDILLDTYHVRMEVTYTMVIAYACKLFSLCFLVLLPRQKAEVQELKKNGGTSKFMGGITVAYVFFALCWSVTTNLLLRSSC
jgi:hypothetical protein